MNISIITPGAKGGYGGISKYNANLVDYFIKKDEYKKIHLFSRTSTNYKNLKINNISEENIIIFSIRLLINHFNLMRSDIIFISHINLIMFCIFPILLGKKVILLNYGLEIWGIEKNFLYKWLIKKIPFFICMREFTKKKLIRKYELKKKIFFDLPNAIKFRNIKISKKKTNDLITVARLDSSEKYKGIDETLEVMAKMNKINFKYKIIGDGDDKMRLILKAKSLGCLKHVNFYGKISDKKRDILLKNSKIMIMPGSDKTYDTYPFRFIFLEAAEFGLYIIGSNPPEKKEKNLEKKYLTFNFVNPKDKNNIINLIKKLQKKNKIKDKNLFQDFSIKSFDKNLSKIIKKISR